MRYKLRAVRLILTTLILFLITWYYQVPERVWGLITIWFVMFEYENVGGVLIKGFYRFAGTTVSAIYGLLIIYFYYNDVVINMIAIVPAVFMYVYLFMDTERSYIAIIGCVTLTIVLLNHNDIDAAILRTFNVILGIISSMFMMRFFYPQYARDQIMRMQSDFILQISNSIQNYLNSEKSLDVLKKEESEQDQSISARFTAFNRHLKEAKAETRKYPAFILHHQKAMEHIRHIFRLFDIFIHFVTTEEQRQSKAIQYQCQELLDLLCTIEKKLKHRALSHEHRTIETQHSYSAHAMLDTLYQEILLLDQEIQHIVLLYTNMIEA